MELTLRFCLLVLLPCVLAQFGPDAGYSGGLQISRADLNAAIDRARQLVEALEEYEKNIFDSGIWARPGSSASFVAAFAKASIESKLLSKGAIVALETTKALARGYRLSKRDIWYEMPKVDVSGTFLSEVCGRRGFSRQCHPSKYRTVDGSCNNLRYPTWGMAKTPFRRLLPPDYADGVDKPRASRDGSPLPNARLVSTSIHDTSSHLAQQVTLMVMQWGQWTDHDITLTPMTTGYNMSTLECCPVPAKDGSFHYLHPACLPIMVPRNDSWYSRYGERCLSFSRSEATPVEYCKLGVREQMNELTSYIDTSNIYGSTEEKAARLRLFRGGLMRWRNHPEGSRLKPLLPFASGIDACIPENHRFIKCFEAGDERVNEQMALASMHTIWMREHNRMASALGKLNPHWDDETIYQESRRVIVAMNQYITYNEFLPVVLGKRYMDENGLSLVDNGYGYGYDENVDPSSTNVFATAAFRFGHTLLPNQVARPGASHYNPRDDIDLSDLFFRPFVLYSGKHPRGVDALMRGIASAPAETFDRHITREVRDRLFKEAGKNFGMDLPALNVQRGREHGIPGYNYWREFCGLRRARDFYELSNEVDGYSVEQFTKLYRHVDDIDLFPALVSERPVPGALVGPTLQCILGKQFEAYKKGDRFWFENGNQPNSFTPAQLAEIRKVTMARIMCANTDDMRTMQPRCMFQDDNSGNSKRDCDRLPEMNLSVWRDGIHNDLDGAFGPGGLPGLSRNINPLLASSSLQQSPRFPAFSNIGSGLPSADDILSKVAAGVRTFNYQPPAPPGPAHPAHLLAIATQAQDIAPFKK